MMRKKKLKFLKNRTITLLRHTEEYMTMAKLIVYGGIAMIGLNAFGAMTTSSMVSQLINQITKAVLM